MDELNISIVYKTNGLTNLRYKKLVSPQVNHEKIMLIRWSECPH